MRLGSAPPSGAKSVTRRPAGTRARAPRCRAAGLLDGQGVGEDVAPAVGGDHAGGEVPGVFTPRAAGSHPGGSTPAAIGVTNRARSGAIRHSRNAANRSDTGSGSAPGQRPGRRRRRPGRQRPARSGVQLAVQRLVARHAGQPPRCSRMFSASPWLCRRWTTAPSRRPRARDSRSGGLLPLITSYAAQVGLLQEAHRHRQGVHRRLVGYCTVATTSRAIGPR